MKNNRYDYFITIISLFILFIIIFFCSSVEAAFLWGGVLLSELLIIGAPLLRCFGSV